MAKKVTHGELQEAAKDQNIDPEQDYETLREEIEIHTCKWCRDEFLTGWSDGFCTDGCEVDYINEFYR